MVAECPVCLSVREACECERPGDYDDHDDCEGCPECLPDPEPPCYCGAPEGYCKC